MNNTNPFVPQGSFLEQKNKARARLRLVVFSSITVSVFALMALLIQGCRKNDSSTDEAANTNNTPPSETVSSNAPVDTNPPQVPVDTNPPPPLPPPPPPLPPAPTTPDYTVLHGDTFATIAHKSNVTVKQIEDANPGVDPKKLQVGQKLHIPAPTTSGAPMAPMAGSSPADTAAASGMQTYKVKSNDTLTGIAKQFHTTIKAIESANGLSTTSIRVGQTLKIPVKAAPAPPPEAPTAPPPSAPTLLPPATTTNH